MSSFLRFLALACCVIATAVNADQGPARGKFLVASEALQGPHFAKSVILLLQYDDSGAVGLIVNRPMDAAPVEALPELEGLDSYRGTLYWGGPVRMFTIRALLRTDSPPENAVQVIDAVHLVPLDEPLPEGASSASNLRLFVGYAGWSPGQLEAELARGSWHILPATEELVFAKDWSRIWQRLVPPTQYRAAIRVGPT